MQIVKATEVQTVVTLEIWAQRYNPEAPWAPLSRPFGAPSAPFETPLAPPPRITVFHTPLTSHQVFFRSSGS